MILHNDIERFPTLIKFTAEHFKILPAFIEKDYWITRSLQRLSQNPNKEKVVFKGGTSLAKAYRLTNRFSEDIDIAVIDANSFSGNQLKMLIKRLAKDMASGLEENVVPHTTSKGSRFYRALYKYPQIQELSAVPINSGQILIEINTYANPYPYIKQEITCFITDYLTTINRLDLIEEYQMQPFVINVLDKRRTIVEKLVSLVRFSFSTDITKALAGKIRHFYDLYYLVNDSECAEYIKSDDFKSDLMELMRHDQQEFDEPQGWQTKAFADSPLTKDFPVLWENVRFVYQTELAQLSYGIIPNEKLVMESFMNLMQIVEK
ncbi:MAG: nucleotidyl transferase AbiEii/AbiGii toxin family protein [Prevotella sp.]|nr:nucleotidyl transferase AbiEii/AbiGii toxin family protein [Prevotella sp.]